MSKLDELYRKNISFLKKPGNNFKEYQHEPVFSYMDAEKVRRKYGLTGIESKSIFLKSKDRRWFIYLTVEGKRADLKKVKKMIGAKVSVASDEDLTEQTGCLAGCAVPFGHSEKISLIVDPEIFECEKFIFSPGPADRTIEVDQQTLVKIMNNQCSPVIRI